MQMKTKIISSQTADSKPVKEDVNGTVILPRLVFPGQTSKMKFSKLLTVIVTTVVPYRERGLDVLLNLAGSNAPWVYISS